MTKNKQIYIVILIGVDIPFCCIDQKQTPSALIYILMEASNDVEMKMSNVAKSKPEPGNNLPWY